MLPSRPALSRERSRNISRISTLFGRPPFQPSKEKSCVEAISRADRVHRYYRNSGHGKRPSFRTNDRTSGSALYCHPGNAAAEFLQCVLQRRFVRHAAGFPFVRQKQVNIIQQVGEYAAPSSAGVIVGVERNGQACAFQLHERVQEDPVREREAGRAMRDESALPI